MNDIKDLLEETFVLIKPDGVARSLVGNIFQRFEQQGLKLVAARMVMPTEQQVRDHYPGKNEKWLKGIGEKAIDNYDGDLKAVKADMGTDDKLEIGTIVYNNFVTYLTEGPVVISVWQGNQAIERVRKLAGSTVPTFAEIGSIRGTYAFDTPRLAVKSKRVVFKNVLHISDSLEEAQREMNIWFKDKYKPLDNYERIDYIDIF